MGHDRPPHPSPNEQSQRALYDQQTGARRLPPPGAISGDRHMSQRKKLTDILHGRAEVHTEAYLSAFAFGVDFRRHLETTGSTKDYNGVCWAPWLW
jgi:hypothetical protein